MDTNDGSVIVVRGGAGWVEVEEGIGEINGDGKNQEILKDHIIKQNLLCVFF